VIRFVLPVILTVLFPVGGMYYLCGRFSLIGLNFATICMIYPVVIVFMFWCFFKGIVKLSGSGQEGMGNERLLLIAETGFPLVFVGLLLAPFVFGEKLGMSRLGMGLVGVGLRHRVESEVDIAATRVWLESLDDELGEYTEDGVVYVISSKYFSRSDLPESLRGLKGAMAVLSADENGSARVRLEWGGTPSGHWGIVIGMKDMETPPSEFSPEVKHIVPVEPGVYVWWGE